MRRARLALVAATLATGCVSLSTFQSPEVLEPRSFAVGTGLSVIHGDAGIGAVPEVYGRYGLSRRFDAGAKFVGFPPLGVLAADLKGQLLREPVALAVDLAASYGAIFVDDGDDDGYAFVALYPALLAGTRRVYAGAKLIHVIAGRIEDDDFESETLPGLFAGFTLGDGFRVRPELHLYFDEQDGGRELLPLAGLAVEWRVNL